MESSSFDTLALGNQREGCASFSGALYRELLPPFASASGKDLPASRGMLPSEEAVRPPSFFLFWVIGKRHAIHATRPKDVSQVV